MQPSPGAVKARFTIHGSRRAPQDAAKATQGDIPWTIGHSSRGRDMLVSMLGEAAIEVLADVRRFVGSRLLAPGRSEPHPYAAAARIVDGRLEYSLPVGPQPSLS